MYGQNSYTERQHIYLYLLTFVNVACRLLFNRWILLYNYNQCTRSNYMTSCSIKKPTHVMWHNLIDNEVEIISPPPPPFKAIIKLTTGCCPWNMLHSDAAYAQYTHRRHHTHTMIYLIITYAHKHTLKTSTYCSCEMMTLCIEICHYYMTQIYMQYVHPIAISEGFRFKLCLYNRPHWTHYHTHGDITCVCVCGSDLSDGWYWYLELSEYWCG